jgi:hypothetical protein
MTDRETGIARKLTDHLDRGLADIRPGTLHRLQRARAQALAAVPATVGSRAYAGMSWMI